MLLEKFGGKVPGTMDELLELPGVGRKTANLILGDVYHTPGVVGADTHKIYQVKHPHTHHNAYLLLFVLFCEVVAPGPQRTNRAWSLPHRLRGLQHL